MKKLTINLIVLVILSSIIGCSDDSSVDKKQVVTQPEVVIQPQVIIQTPKNTQPEYDGVYYETKNGDFIDLKATSSKNKPSGGKCLIKNDKYPFVVNEIPLDNFKRFALRGWSASDFDHRRLVVLDNGGDFEKGYEWFCRKSYVDFKKKVDGQSFFIKPMSTEKGKLYRMALRGPNIIIKFK